MYNILGIFKGLNNNAKSEQLNESVKQPTVYETVEPKGSIMEAVKSLEEKYMGFKAVEKAAKKGGAENPAAVAASIGRKKYGKKAFQKAAAAGKKMGEGKDYCDACDSTECHCDEVNEAAKPDFLDVDKDGNKKEPFKKAVKDAKKVKEGIEDRLELAREKAAAKGKIKDKEKETPKSASRFVKGKAYGGSAQKDAEEKDDLDEGQGPYELYNPKHPKFKANYDKWMAKNPGKKLADFIEAMKAREAKMNEAVRIQGAADYDGKMAAPKNQRERDEFAARAKHERAKNRNDMSASPNRKGLKSVQNPDKPWGTDHDLKATVDEVAPPGAKAERMVKHIKKGYAKDGKLTPKEKSIAYATAWKAHNKGQVEENVQFGDTVKNSTPKLSKVKLKESRMMEGEYDYEKVGRMLAQQNPNLDSNSSEFVDAVYAELKKMGLTPKHAQYLIKYDEDFLGDAATSYGYFCKNKEDEVAESGDLVNDQFGVTTELDEIAKLAGLKTEMDSKVPGDSASPLTYAGCPVCEADPCSCAHEEELDERETFASMPKAGPTSTPTAPAVKPASYDKSKLNPMEEEEMGEGNEFSGALAAAKASGAKEFEVGGKKYTVKEDVNVNISTTGEFDSINLIRQLAGLNTYAHTMGAKQSTDGGPQGAVVDSEPEAGQDIGLEEDGPKERDVEYTNSPREEQAGADAAFPGGTDLNRPKKSYSDKPYHGDNPMAVQEAREEALWKAYESMIKDVKA